MKYLRRFKSLNAYTVNFHSPDPRHTRDRRENPKILAPNNDFDLPFIIPNTIDKIPNGDVIIIVNGYNQPKESLRMYFEKRIGICRLLQRRGYTSILLPIPFHLWRSPIEGIFSIPQYTIAHRINADMTRFYLGFKQLLLDIEGLAKALLGHTKPRIELPFDVKRIHLLGYSLGGLGTASAFIIDRFHKSNLFSSSTMLFSGANLKCVEPRGTGITKAELTALGEYYTTGNNSFLKDFQGHISASNEKKSRRLGTFKYFVFGQYNKSIRELLKNEVKRMPVIIGQDDLVMPYREVIKFIPSASRKLLIDTIPGVGHFLWRDKEWQKRGARNSINKLADTLDRLK